MAYRTTPRFGVLWGSRFCCRQMVKPTNVQYRRCARIPLCDRDDNTWPKPVWNVVHQTSTPPKRDGGGGWGWTYIAPQVHRWERCRWFARCIGTRDFFASKYAWVWVRFCWSTLRTWEKHISARMGNAQHTHHSLPIQIRACFVWGGRMVYRSGAQHPLGTYTAQPREELGSWKMREIPFQDFPTLRDDPGCRHRLGCRSPCWWWGAHI